MRFAALGAATVRAGGWSEITEELRRIQAIYATKESAEAALMDHIGMQTR
jgi:hypothetical protein